MVRLGKTSAVSAFIALLLAFQVLSALPVNGSGFWFWVRDAVTGAYGEAVAGTGEAIYIARGAGFYRYLPSDNSFVQLAAPPDGFKTGTALAWDFGDYIYALLGAASTESRRFFYRYSISSDQWTRLADTPADQGEGNAITYVEGLGVLAIIGGEQRPTYFMLYDSASDSWSDAPADPPAGTGDGASLAWTGGDFVYAMRGEFYEDEPCYDFWTYSISNDTWQTLAPIPAEPHDGGSGGVGDGGSLLYVGFWLQNQTDYIYALSGNQAYPETPQPIADRRFYRYKISTDTWERLEDLPFGVGYYVGNRLGYAEGHIYAWQGAPSTWEGGGDDLARYEFTAYALTISATAGGTTNPAPGTYTYPADSQVQVAAIPSSGYRFDYWLLDGNVVLDNPVTVSMDADHTLKAFFASTMVTVQLSTYSGPIGVQVTVSGTIENPGAEFKVFWDHIGGWDGRYGFLVSGYAEGYDYTANITIPPAARGDHYVIVEDEKNHATGYAVFTVTPEITVQPDTAPGGAIVSVGGRLINGETIDVRFYDPISGRETTVAQAVTDPATGALSCNFKVPAWSEGDYKVRAYWSGSLQAEAMFHIGYQGITVVPDKAPPNAIVRVSGGLAINETFIIAFENSTWSVTVAIVQTDQSGWFAVNVTVPEASPGNYFVRASSDDIDVEVPFEILPPANLEVYSDAANTGEALPGFSVITAIGTNFIANANVSIYFQSNPVLVAETATDSLGSFTAQFTVPSDASAGTHTIFAVQDPYNVSASATIIVHSVVIVPYAMLNYPNSVVLYVPGDTIAFYVNSTTPFEVPSEIVVNVYDPSGIPYTPQGIHVNAGNDIVNVNGFYVAPYDRIAFWPEIPKGAPSGIWTWNATYHLQLYPGVQFNASGIFGVIPQPDLNYILQRLNQIEAKIDGIAYKQDQLYLLIQANQNYVMARLDQLEANLVSVTQSGFAEVNTKLGVIQLKLDLLDAKVTSIQDNVAIIQTSLGTLTADVSELKSMLAQVNATIVEVKDGVATIQAGVGEIKADLAALNATVVDVKDGVASVQTAIGTISAKLDAVNATIVGVVTDAKGEVLAKIDTAMGTVYTSLDELKASLAGAEASITNLVTNATGAVVARIDSAETSILARLDALNATVVGVKDDLKGGFAQVETILGTVNVKLDELKAFIENSNANITKLIVDCKGEVIAEIAAGKAELKANLDALNASVVSVQEGVATLNTAVGELKVSLADLRANVTQLIVDAKGEAIVQMQTLLEPVNATLQDMGGKITAIHGNVADVVIPGIGQLQVAVASAQQSAENASEAVSGLNTLIYAVLALSIVAAALSAFNLLHIRRRETAS